MAIFTPLQGTGGISDATINAMLQSGDADLVKQANDYIAAREQEVKERGADKGILGAISNLFGFSKLAADEPNMPSSQKFSNQFSVTQPSQFDFKGAQLFDPTNMMRGSVVEDVVNTPTREFGQIRAGQDELGIFGVPKVQDLPVDLEELAALEDDIIEQQLAAASRGEGETFFDRLRDVGGNVLDYIRGGGVIGRGITSLANMAGDTFRGSRFYNPITESGNRLFTPFSRPGNPSGMRTRRAADRISYMLNRGAAGKGFGQTNLDNIMRGFGLQNVDTGSMMDSIAQSAKTGYGGYGSSDAAAAAAASGGRDYSSSPGAMAGDMEYDEE